MIHWLVIAILYIGGVPANSKIFVLDPGEVKTAKDCEAKKKEMLAEAKELKADVWLKCVEVLKPERNA